MIDIEVESKTFQNTEELSLGIKLLNACLFYKSRLLDFSLGYIKLFFPLLSFMVFASPKFSACYISAFLIQEMKCPISFCSDHPAKDWANAHQGQNGTQRCPRAISET